MSSIPFTTYNPDAEPDPTARQGQTVMAPTVVGGAPLNTADAPPTPNSPQMNTEDGQWDMGYTSPIPRQGQGPKLDYESDLKLHPEDEDLATRLKQSAPRAKPVALVASTDAEKEAHFQALRHMFGLGPDSPPPAEPARVNPDANAHPSSPEFKAWLRSSSPEEFQKWMESGGAQAAPPAPTEAAIAKARAALAPPISAGELSQQMAAMPPRQPTPMEQAAASAERYQAAAGAPLSARERVLMLKAIAEKYGTPAPEERGFLDTASAGAHALLDPLLDPRRQVAREGVAGQAARALNVSRGLIPEPRPAPTPEQKSAVAKFFADAARGVGMIGAPAPPDLAKTGVAYHAAGDMNLTANPMIADPAGYAERLRAAREAAGIRAIEEKYGRPVAPAPVPADDAAARDKRFADALLSLGRK